MTGACVTYPREGWQIFCTGIDFRGKGLTVNRNVVTLTITLWLEGAGVKVLTAAEMQRAERECAGIGISTDMLMENAGRAVAGEVGRILGGVERKHILLLIGPGNNGGDGLVAARHLHDRGAKVSLFLLGQRAGDDANLKLVRERGIDCYEDPAGLEELLPQASAVIDALFGTGRSRPLSGVFRQTLERVAEAKKEHSGLKVIALDLPSGLDADTGACDAACLYADHTITLGFLKPGLYNSPGAGRAGLVTVVDIGIPEQLVKGITTELITDNWARQVLPGRPVDANKGSFGQVLVVAGSINYIGAAYLACSGATRVGAGLVTLATASSLVPVLAAKLTETTYLPLPESTPGIVADEATGVVLAELGNYSVMLLGCGLGQSEQAMKLIRSVLLQSEKTLPRLVLDADALNTLARIPGWWRKLEGDAVLTPHPGEMERLTGLAVDKIQSDRAGTARRAAAEWGKTVVLKGAYTVIASPDGGVKICPAANPGLASAGTGDVLAGIIAGLLAQGLVSFTAAALGVWLHARAGEMVKAELGDAGMLASDLLPVLPKVIKGLKEV
jgi:NAD(P)H-hydrate epimerase